MSSEETADIETVDVVGMLYVNGIELLGHHMIVTARTSEEYLVINVVVDVDHVIESLQPFR